MPLPVTATLLDKLNFLAATGLYSGLAPKAPGTAGSLAATLLLGSLYFFVPGSRSLEVTICVALAVTVVGVFAVASLLKREMLGEAEDPQIVVIDEFAGIAVAAVGSEGNLWLLLPVFLLFRVFDITKFFPANRAEELPGAWGIMADDLVAGVYAALVLNLAVWAVG